MTNNEFHIGDRVIYEYAGGLALPLNGMTGTVVSKYSPTRALGVSFDGFTRGHNCHGPAKIDRVGLFFPKIYVISKALSRNLRLHSTTSLEVELYDDGRLLCWSPCSIYR